MAQREPTDESLMVEVASGQESALEQLMKRYHGPLLAFIHRQTDIEAEDLYQEAWLRVVRSAHTFDPERKFSTWLFQIALNQCRDAYRRRESRPRTVDIDEAEQVIEAWPDVDDDVEILRLGIAALPERDREILALRYFQGFSEKEVAVILDVPLGTVKGRTHRAVKRLKKIMRRKR